MCETCQKVVDGMEKSREVTEESRLLLEESRQNHSPQWIAFAVERFENHLSLEIRQQQKENEEED